MATPFKKAAEDHCHYILERPASAEDILKMAKSILRKRHRRGSVLSSPKASRDYFQIHLATYEHEVFGVLFLDNRHRVIAFEELFRGTIDGASVHPREVVKTALQYNAAAVILVHNHPSGIAEPSRADRAITRRLQEVLNLIDVRLLDHFIVAGTNIVSFAERGLL